MKIHEFTRRSLIAGTFVLNQRLQEHLLRVLKAQEISYVGALILVALYFEHKDSVGPSRLATALQFSRSRVSQEITRLERAGFLVRVLTANDSRRFALKLNQRGEKCALSVIKTFDNVQRKIDAALGERRAESLNRDLLSTSALFRDPGR